MRKTVFVTGATNGTGFAIARRFAREGFDVCITSREAERAKEAALRLREEIGGGIETFGYGLDVGNEQDVVDIFSDIRKSGRLVNALVLNSASLAIGMPDFFEVPLSDWMKVMETNLGWNFSIARQAAIHMREMGKGSIVFIGSVTAIRAIKNRSAYSTSKSGIHGLVRNLAVELGQYGIRVNTIAAGSIKTERWHKRPEIRNSPMSLVPLGDVVEFDDVANAAWFFGSDESRIVTGAELAVDGGALAQLVYEEKGI